MDLLQLYSAATRLALAISTSGVMVATKNYRNHLGEGIPVTSTPADSDADSGTNPDSTNSSSTKQSLAEAMLLRAGSDYLEQADRFTDDDRRVAEHFHLHELASTSYWSALTDSGVAATKRRSELVSLYSRLMFATGHVPRLLALVRESSVLVRQPDAGKGTLLLEMRDLSVPNAGADELIESAADPDRISRVIDGANMLYRAAALLAGSSVDALRLMSIHGNEQRKLVFQGDLEPITAVTRIVRHLNKISAQGSASESSSTGAGRPQHDSKESQTEATAGPIGFAERVVEQLPFLNSLDELEKIGALSPELSGDISSNTTAGAIMLIEAAVTVADNQLQAADLLSVAADVNTGSFDGVDGQVEAEVEAHYLDHFAAVRERMLSESADSTRLAEETSPPLHQPATSRDSSSDDLDDLIVDINRLYKR